MISVGSWIKYTIDFGKHFVQLPQFRSQRLLGDPHIDTGSHHLRRIISRDLDK